MHWVIAICVVIVLALWLLVWMLKDAKKSGELENEIKRRKEFSKTLEAIRKIQANSANLTREQRNERLRKYDSA